MSDTKIHYHFFHGIYTNLNSYAVGTTDLSHRLGFADIPFIYTPAIIGVPSDTDYLKDPGIYYWFAYTSMQELIRGQKKIIEFKSEEEAFKAYKKTKLKDKYDKIKIPFVKNYFKFNKKDLHKYRFLFNGMLKTGRITANGYINSKKVTDVFYIDDSDPENPTPKKETYTRTIDASLYIDVDGRTLINDKNFENRLPFNSLHYFGGHNFYNGDENGQIYNLLSNDEIWDNLGSPINYSNFFPLIYKNNWEFNSDIFTPNSSLIFSNKQYPFDRTNLNNPVLPYKIGNTYLAPLINFYFGGTTDIHSSFGEFSSNNAGNVTASIKIEDDSGDDPNLTKGGSRLKVNATLSSIIYLDSTEEFMVFIEFNSVLNCTDTPSIVNTTNENFYNIIKYREGVNYLVEYFDPPIVELEPKIGSLDIYIEGDDGNSISQSIEILDASNSFSIRDQYDPEPSEDKFGYYNNETSLTFGIDQLNLFLYGWKKDDFDRNNFFPKKIDL